MIPTPSCPLQGAPMRTREGHGLALSLPAPFPSTSIVPRPGAEHIPRTAMLVEPKG